MSEIAALITAIMTSLSFLCVIYKDVLERKNNRMILRMLIHNLYDDFKRQRDILDKILSDDPEKQLEEVLSPYIYDLKCRSAEINELKKYEEVCWKNFTEEEIAVVRDYVKKLNYFFNLITTILSATEKPCTLCDYKTSLIESVSEEQCTLFCANKNLSCDLFCSKCFDKIDKDWRNVDKTLNKF